ncbi:MAG: MBL fold metallo-hydrolase [Hyphomicrobiaceae bacterium]
MRLTVVGCGDAFGSGGRLQTCYHFESAGQRFLIDCGATAVIGLNRLGLDTNCVGTIIISHLHGDHFAGLVWWMLHSQHVVKRTTPLTIIGPPTVEARFQAAAEALFPKSTTVALRFPMIFREITAATPLDVPEIGRLTAYEVKHPSGAPSHALRLQTPTRTIAFSGDTEWVDALVPCGKEADLYIMDCYAWDGKIPFHLSWETIRGNLPHIAARKTMLTHMSAPMLQRSREATGPGVFLAEDGLVVDI